MYVNKFEGLRASWEEASWCSRALFSLKKDLGRLDKDMCNIAWSMFLISQCESSCFKSFVSAQCLQQYFSKTFLCRNILKERTFFLGRVRESPSDRRNTKLRMVCILNFIYISALIFATSPRLQSFRTPSHCAIVCTVAFSFLLAQQRLAHVTRLLSVALPLWSLLWPAGTFNHFPLYAPRALSGFSVMASTPSSLDAVSCLSLLLMLELRELWAHVLIHVK